MIFKVLKRIMSVLQSVPQNHMASCIFPSIGLQLNAKMGGAIFSVILNVVFMYNGLCKLEL